jgi:predicted lactoylglutathione lyase
MSLVVSQPSIVDSLIGTALDGGATTLKPAEKSFWGYGGVVRAPDGAIWKISCSSKKDTGPATRKIDDVVLLLGVADVKASKRFYVENGLTVAKSFGGKYVQFESAPKAIKLALYPRRALAKEAGLAPEGTGSSSAARPNRSPTRTGSCGRPTASTRRQPKKRRSARSCDARSADGARESLGYQLV